MPQSHRERLKSLLEQALELPVEKRRAFIEGVDEELRSELVSLIAHAGDAPEFFESLAGGVLPQFETTRPNDPLIAKTVAHYEVLERLGGGGMGVVYKARDTKLDRIVALKFLAAHLSADEDLKQRFIQEAKAASSLDHPNIGYIHEINEMEDGRLFIAMAYYEGETLKAKIARGPLPVEEATSYARQIAEGLSKAHAAGIVHRDIKPANLLVTDEGVVKIVDFGIAKMAGVEQLTKTGSTIGTMAYMSPEQLQGNEVDQRTDLWSLGVVLYEMLTSERPFKGDFEGALVYEIAHGEFEEVEKLRDSVPESLALTIKGLLQKDTASRIQKAEDVVSGLASPEGSSVVIQRMPHPMAQPYVWLGLAVILVAALASLFWIGYSVPASEAMQEESLDETRLAILPFDVRPGDDLANWREDMVEVLHLAIQSTEEVSSVDPNAMLLYTEDDVLASKDPVRGAEIARHFNAGWYVIGRVTQLGDQIRVIPRMYRTEGEPVDIDPVVLTGELAIQVAADTLAQRVAGVMLDKPGLRMSSLASQTTNSPAAFRHYVQAQKLYREKRFEEAEAAYKSALSLDSTFALAAFEYANLMHDLMSPGWMDQQRELHEQARRHLKRLPLPKQWLLEAVNSAFIQGNLDQAEVLYKKYLDLYPDDGYALVTFGDFLFHYNPMRARSSRESIEYLEKGYEIVRSDQDDALLHLGNFAIKDRDFERYVWIKAQQDSIRNIPPDWAERTYRTIVLTEPDARGPYIDSLAPHRSLLTLGLYFAHERLSKCTSSE